MVETPDELAEKLEGEPFVTGAHGQEAGGALGGGVGPRGGGEDLAWGLRQSARGGRGSSVRGGGGGTGEGSTFQKTTRSARFLTSPSVAVMAPLRWMGFEVGRGGRGVGGIDSGAQGIGQGDGQSLGADGEGVQAGDAGAGAARRGAGRRGWRAASGVAGWLLMVARGRLVRS